MSKAVSVVDSSRTERLALNRGLSITQSYLRSWGVPFDLDHPYVSVSGKKVGFDPGADIALDLNAINDAYNMDRPLAEMDRVAQGCGFTRPVVSKRHTLRADRDDHQGRALSLNAFAKAARQPDAIFEKYARVIEQQANRAYREHADVVRTHLLDIEEVQNTARIFAQCFFHRGMDPSENDTCAKLARFLFTEFLRWADILRKDGRNIVPDLDPNDGIIAGVPVPGASLTISFDDTDPAESDEAYAVRVAAYVWDAEAAMDMEVEEAEEITEAERSRIERLETKAAKARSASAKAALDDGLSRMPHDTLVNELERVAKSFHVAAEAKALAAKKLAQHRAGCAECAKLKAV